MALLKTHPFKEAFVAGRTNAYLINLRSHGAPRGGISPLRQKYNADKACVFVFQTIEAAEHEYNCLPKAVKLDILEVSYSGLREALAAAPVIPTVIFARDENGNYAELEGPAEGGRPGIALS
jgi:hypothetical protein